MDFCNPQPALQGDDTWQIQLPAISLKLHIFFFEILSPEPAPASGWPPNTACVPSNHVEFNQSAWQTANSLLFCPEKKIRPVLTGPNWTGKQEFTDSLESQLVVQRHWHKFVGARSWLPLGFLKQCQPTNMHSVSDCVSAMVPCLQWCFDTFESLKFWNSEAWAIVLSQTNRKWESGSETAV